MSETYLPIPSDPSQIVAVIKMLTDELTSSGGTNHVTWLSLRYSVKDIQELIVKLNLLPVGCSMQNPFNEETAVLETTKLWMIITNDAFIAANDPSWNDVYLKW